MLITIAAPERVAYLAYEIATALKPLGLPVACAIVDRIEEIAGLDQIEILVSIIVPCGGGEMDQMPRLRAIVSPLLGFEWIDVAAATARDIHVVNGEAPENREGMAEAGIMLLLACLYRLRETEQLLRSNAPGDDLPRRMLKNSTIGLIGFGGISREIMRRLTPWGCRFLVTTRGQGESLPDTRFVPLDELLARSDSILVLTSLDTGTRQMIGAAELAKVRTGATLVNIARGAIIDQSALCAALRDGRVGYAALDVFEIEPLPADDPLRELPNVILTPHAIGHTEEGRSALPRVAAENVIMLVQGQLPASCRNRAALEARRAG